MTYLSRAETVKRGTVKGRKLEKAVRKVEVWRVVK